MPDATPPASRPPLPLPTDAPYSVYPRADEPKAPAPEQTTPARRRHLAKFWLVIAVLATVSAGVWLGVVEHANIKASNTLQALNADPSLRPDWWVPDISREQIVAQEAVDADGNPLLNPDGTPAIEPFADEDIQARIEARWEPYSTRGMLHFTLRGFGTLFYGLAFGAIAASLLALRHTAGPIRFLPLTLVLLTAALLTRATWLGVFRHAWLD